MDKEQFHDLAQQGFTHVPVVRKMFADFDTPLSIYQKLALQPFSYLLESAAQGGERWNRYSIIGLPCETVIEVVQSRISILERGRVVESFDCDDPLSFIESYQSSFRVPQLPQMPRFFGGLVGYFGYDTVRYVEHRLRDSTPPDTVGIPDILLMVSKDLVVFDNVTSYVQLIVLGETQQHDAWTTAHARLDEIEDLFQRPVAASYKFPTIELLEEDDFESEYGRESYTRDVETVLEYIGAGDAMQVVLAQRLSTKFKAPPLHLYRALRSLNPSPYMYFMDLGEFHIVASTPEILARVDDGVVVSRPLAGTRRRGRTQEEDLALEKELLADPKETSEHLMLIDLGRNDLGRVSQTGTVKVTEKFVVERYSHVMHISSNVEGLLQDDKSSMDVLRATLPVGTLSGAPKVRAMEIIDELEPVKRGIYGGAVGYLAWNNNMDMAIAIRTAVVKNGRLYVQAGGGIVADSVPDLEWEESMNKARVIFHAARLACSGLKIVD